MKKKAKLTNKYVFTITKLTKRPLTWEETHGNHYQMNKLRYGEDIEEGSEVEEILWEDKFEIEDERVIEILKGLLKKTHMSSI